jgi:hypothetical protein
MMVIALILYQFIWRSSSLHLRFLCIRVAISSATDTALSYETTSVRIVYVGILQVLNKDTYCYCYTNSDCSAP